MKTLLAGLYLCLAFTAQAQTWPHNPKTGKVEFMGVLPWPATAKTEAQRKALARRWYLAKLTDSTPEEVAADVQTTVSLSLLTYAGLPVVAQMQQGQPDSGFRLLYLVRLSGSKTGLSYAISSFTFAKRNQEDSAPLEPYLTTSDKNEQAALAVLRKRLANAVRGWN